MPIRRMLRAALAAALIVALFCGAALADVIHDVPALDEEALFGEALLLLDADTGEVIYSKDPGVRMYPASTTKIMTLLLALESDIDLDKVVTVPKAAGKIPEGSSTIPVKPGDKLTFRDLLYGFMLNSGNDGANAIAVLVDGSIDAFVARMNARAKKLGCKGTHFTNAHGYHNENHYTTARDLALITHEAMKNETFRQIVATPEWKVTLSRNGKKQTLDIPSRVLMVREEEKFYYADCTGVKTGFHSKAGYCFVGTATRNGVNLMCVTLNCPKENQKWYDAARLFEYGFGLYAPYPLGDLARQVAVEYAGATIENASDEDPDSGNLRMDLGAVEDGGATRMLIVDSDESLENALSELRAGARVEWSRELVAPVQKGEAMGRVVFELADGSSASVALLASRDVAEKVVETPAPTEPEKQHGGAATPKTPKTPGKPGGGLPGDSNGNSGASENGAGLHAGLIVALAALAALIAVLIVAASIKEKRRRERLRRRRAARRSQASAVRRAPVAARGGVRRGAR